MKMLNTKIADMSSHLQSLATSEFYPQVEEAVERKDKNLLIKVCRKAKIPQIDINPVVSLLLSISNAVKWPELF
jgi:hypothetical protein